MCKWVIINTIIYYRFFQSTHPSDGWLVSLWFFFRHVAGILSIIAVKT